MALVLARPHGAPAGHAGRLAVPAAAERLEDGTANSYRIVRLKDKLGTRSMASGEIRLDGATAYLVGEPRRGFQQMADMVNPSRLSNGVRAAGMMRRASTRRCSSRRNRRAFGRRHRRDAADAPPVDEDHAADRAGAACMVFQAAQALAPRRRGDEDGA